MSDRTKKLVGWAVIVAATVAAMFLGIRYPVPEPPVDMQDLAGRPVQFGPLQVNGALGVSGAADIGGAVNYGSNSLYPVGNTADGKKLLVGVTGGVVQKATVVPTVAYISTVTAFGCSPQSSSFTGAWDCRVQLGASNQVTMTLYEADATPVPTASYAKIQYWVAGN